jgi:hypothetical protein
MTPVLSGRTVQPGRPSTDELGPDEPDPYLPSPPLC